VILSAFTVPTIVGARPPHANSAEATATVLVSVALGPPLRETV
jgi:hypothetical protein